MGPQGNTHVALDEGAYTTVIRITDDLDVVHLGVGREVIVKSTNQLSVIHCGGETSDEDAGLVGEFWEITVSGASRLECQLRGGGGRGG